MRNERNNWDPLSKSVVTPLLQGDSWHFLVTECASIYSRSVWYDLSVYNSFPSIKHTAPSGVDSSRKETSSDPLSPHPLVITLITGVCLSMPFHDIASVYYSFYSVSSHHLSLRCLNEVLAPPPQGWSLLSPLVPQLFLLSFTESARHIFRLQKNVYKIFFSNNLLLTHMHRIMNEKWNQGVNSAVQNQQLSLLTFS